MLYSEIEAVIARTNKENIKEHFTNSEKYYLIINDINHGNVTKIFGEALSLIENDKRKGRDNELSYTLPFSRELFTIPSNLYIIGIVNSNNIATILDERIITKFALIECEIIEPSDNFRIENCNNKTVEDIDIKYLLQNLNDILNEETQNNNNHISSDYFLEHNNITIKTLFNIWYYQIIPLITKYCFGDKETIKKIIGADFFYNDKIKKLDDENFKIALDKISYGAHMVEKSKH